MSGWLLRLAVLLALGGLAAMNAFYAGGRSAWFIFGCCMGLTVLGLLASLFMTGTIRAERQIAEVRLTSGGTMHVRGVVTLPFWFPFAYVLLSDEWRGGRSGRYVRGAVLLLPFGRRRVDFAYSIPGMTRGVYRLVRMETEAGDLFHLSGYRKIFTIDDGPEVIVYPGIRRETEYGGRKGRSSDDFGFPGGLREYAEGDSARRIDWKSYVRRGKLMTRLPGEEEGGLTCLVLDPGADDEAFERVVAAAAGYVEQSEERREGEVCIYCAGTGLAIKGGGEWRHTMEQLATLERSGFAVFRRSIAEATALVGTSGELVVVVSGLHDRMAELANIAGMNGAAVTVLYTSARPVLSAAERVMAGELVRLGCEFGYVPARPAFSRLNSSLEEARAYG